MCCAGEVERCDLQVAPVDVTLVQRDTTIGGHLLGGTTAHVVVFAMDACAAAAVDFREIRGAVLCIAAHRPDTGGGLYAGLVASFIVAWDEVGDIIHREHGVLVERVALVAGDFFRVFLCGGAVADVVVGVAIAAVVDGGRSQLGAGIMSEGVIHHRALSSGVASGRSPERVVAVGTLRHKSSTSVIGHAGEQISLNFTAFPNRHA